MIGPQYLEIMNDNQENRVSMFMAVKKVVDKFTAVWTPVAAFVASYGRFELIMDRILTELGIQETATTGVRTDKLAAQEAMIDQALIVAGAVYAFASDTENNTLREAVNYSYSDLRYVRDTISGERARVIHDQANGVVGSLADYGVDAALLLAFDGLIDAYVDVIAAPRVAITVRKGATSNLADDIKMAEKELKEKMDKLMPQFKAGSPDFYGQYFNARIIVNYKGGSSKGSVTGTVTELGSGLPIEGVSVETEGYDAVVTDANGKYELNDMKTGDHDVKYTRAGLETVEKTVTVVAKETVVVDVKMTAAP